MSRRKKRRRTRMRRNMKNVIKRRGRGQGKAEGKTEKQTGGGHGHGKNKKGGHGRGHGGHGRRPPVSPKGSGRKPTSVTPSERPAADTKKFRDRYPPSLFWCNFSSGSMLM